MLSAFSILRGGFKGGKSSKRFWTRSPGERGLCGGRRVPFPAAEGSLASLQAGGAGARPAALQTRSPAAADLCWTPASAGKGTGPAPSPSVLRKTRCALLGVDKEVINSLTYIPLHLKNLFLMWHREVYVTSYIDGHLRHFWNLCPCNKRQLSQPPTCMCHEGGVIYLAETSVFLWSI